MRLEPKNIYHVFNRGNNREIIFPQERNYLFFLKKARKEILPYCDVLCYCLMPNHFHFLVQVNELGCTMSNLGKVRFTSERGMNKPIEVDHQQKLKHGIGILLRSYTRAINTQEQRRGALFQQRTKIKDGWEEHSFITVEDSFFYKFSDGKEYARKCFEYIHQNPVKAKMVQKDTDWTYSSAKDYAGLRNGTLCNQALAKELGLVSSELDNLRF